MKQFNKIKAAERSKTLWCTTKTHSKSGNDPKWQGVNTETRLFVFSTGGGQKHESHVKTAWMMWSQNFYFFLLQPVSLQFNTATWMLPVISIDPALFFIYKTSIWRLQRLKATVKGCNMTTERCEVMTERYNTTTKRYKTTRGTKRC